MTAPAITPSAPAATPAAAPSAPIVPQSLTAAIQSVAAKTSIAPDAPQAAIPQVAIVRNAPPAPDAPGSPDAPAGSAPGSAPVAEPAAVAPDASAEPAPAVEASGELAMEEDGIALRAERNADGTFKTKIDPTAKFDLEFTDKDTGEKKVLTKTLPDILRLAKDGRALQPIVQALKPEVEYYRTEVPRWQETHQRQTADIDALTALNHELLTAPDEIVIQRREEFAAANTPEQRLQRIEAERRAEVDARETSMRQQQVAAQARTFIESRLSTAIKAAESQLGVELVAGKLALATKPLEVNGQIPPDRWPVLEQYINGPFKAWVATEAAKRTTQSDALALREKQTAEAQRRAQAVVNDVGRATAPLGRAAPDGAPVLPKPKNTQEAVQRMINRPLPATVGASG